MILYGSKVSFHSSKVILEPWMSGFCKTLVFREVMIIVIIASFCAKSDYRLENFFLEQRSETIIIIDLNNLSGWEFAPIKNGSPFQVSYFF
jgi:hypothetical protein